MPPASYPAPEDFQNRASMPDEYLYDPDGNLLQDLNAGFTLVYNHLDKPVEIGETATGNTLKITYAADGTKLRQTSYQTGSAPQTLDYSTGYIYKGRVLLYLAHEEGRSLRLNASGNNGGSHGHVHTFRHEYNLRDHLGNVRVSFTDADQDGKPETTQEQHYEAYGLRLGGLTYMGGEEERYLYNGKERIGELGLGWTDFGARMYNPTIGRWNGVDALAEKYDKWSPYNYVYSNPILIKDVDGNSGIVTIDKEQKTVTVSSNIVLYGEAASSALANTVALSIENQWNTANGTVSIEGVTYDVKFKINGFYEPNITAAEISNNKYYENNYYRVEPLGGDFTQSFTSRQNEDLPVERTEPGGNTGMLNYLDILKIEQTTASHEVGHGWGLIPGIGDGHPDLICYGKQPGIMQNRGSLVSAEFTWNPTLGDTKIIYNEDKTISITNTLNPNKRKVLQNEIDMLKLNELKFDSNNQANLGKLTNKWYANPNPPSVGPRLPNGSFYSY